ncbi:hypothetical protein [Pedobacter jamesrossensis]|uniref:Uncharacterized protein n=1 Tax=Pedobacter jamesrossensis TaxID=1908238 RepID=A0ABV8NG68_9SPHI
MVNHISLSQPLNIEWHNNFLSALAEKEVEFELKKKDDFQLVTLTKCNVIINLVNILTNFSPEQLILLQNLIQNEGFKLINLWEDVWKNKPTQVLHRILSLSGENKKIHGRKTKVFKIDKPIADLFLNENHLQGSVSSRYKFGLFINDELLAVATFSALRKMNHTENYKSIELIRFVVKGGFSITGGLSKLVKHMQLLLKPNDLMTYADKDWSAGEAYYKLNFNKVDVIKPQYFVLGTQLKRSLKKGNLEQTNPLVFNTGSIKFILKF